MIEQLQRTLRCLRSNGWSIEYQKAHSQSTALGTLKRWGLDMPYIIVIRLGDAEIQIYRGPKDTFYVYCSSHHAHEHCTLCGLEEIHGKPIEDKPIEDT